MKEVERCGPVFSIDGRHYFLSAGEYNSQSLSGHSMDAWRGDRQCDAHLARLTALLPPRRTASRQGIPNTKANILQ